jgi:putative redox protein
VALHEEIWRLELRSSTRYLDGKSFETLIRGHRIVCDQPISEGGADLGVTPPELLLASLGTCAGHYATEYLRARSLSFNGLAVYVSAEKGTQPARLASFRVDLDCPAVGDKDRQGLLRAVRACLIHNTLTTSPAIHVSVFDATPEPSLVLTR